MQRSSGQMEQKMETSSEAGEGEQIRDRAQDLIRNLLHGVHESDRRTQAYIKALGHANQALRDNEKILQEIWNLSDRYLSVLTLEDLSSITSASKMLKSLRAIHYFTLERERNQAFGRAWPSGGCGAAASASGAPAATSDAPRQSPLGAFSEQSPPLQPRARNKNSNSRSLPGSLQSDSRDSLVSLPLYNELLRFSEARDLENATARLPPHLISPFTPVAQHQFHLLTPSAQRPMPTPHPFMFPPHLPMTMPYMDPYAGMFAHSSCFHQSNTGERN